MILSKIKSIKNKIIAIILLTCFLTVGAGITLVVIMDINRIKDNMVQQTSIAAKLAGEGCVTALTFDYPDTARQNLKHLKSFPAVVNALVFDNKGELFAVYDKEVPIVPSQGFKLEKNHYYRGGHLHLVEPIVYQGKHYGMIYLKVRTAIEDQIIKGILYALSVLLGLLFLAYLIANFVQKIISRPILNLAETAGRISKKADYGVRLDDDTTGEISTLYTAFNQMLDTIQKREQERDNAEHSLLFKEQVVESTSSAIANADLDGTLTYVNFAFMRLFGYIVMTNVVGKPFYMFFETRETFELMLTSLVRQRQWTHETKVMKKNGSLFDAIVSADTILDNAGRPTSFVITVSDISLLRNASREMEKEDFLKTGEGIINDWLRGDLGMSKLASNLLGGLSQFVEFQVGAMYIADDAGILTLKGSYAVFDNNRTFKRRLKPGESLAGQAALEKRIIRVSRLPDDYFKISSGTGETAPNHLMAIPFVYRDETKGVLELGTIGSFKELDMELFKRITRIVAIAIHSSQSREKMQKLLEKTQLQSEELQSQTEELQSQQEELQQANEELEEQTQILEEQQADIKKKNRELEKSRWLVEQKAKDLKITSQYKSEFMANMSHELRTPLNSMLLLSDVLSDNRGGNLTEKQLEFAKSIHTSGLELLNLINDILDLSKVESGKMEFFLEPVAIEEFKKILLRTFGPVSAKKGLDFVITIENGLPEKMITDKQKLEQVLKNLMSNAFKFTSKGGVTLTIGRPEDEDVPLKKDLIQDNTIKFLVTDTGIGIRQENLDVVFEAFKQVDGTTSRKYGGTGLGLSISREMIKLMGGDIRLKSELDRGSSFAVFLPDSLSMEQLKTDDLSRASQSGTNNGSIVKSASLQTAMDPGDSYIIDDRNSVTPDDKCVLIIEDDLAFTKIVGDLAHGEGFKVIIAMEGETGLHFADYYSPSAIILDINLPGIDGWAVLQRLKENLKTRHIPVHIVSAENETQEAMKMGAVGFLSKPVTMERLETVFNKFNILLSTPVKNVLVVEDSSKQCQAVKKIIGNGDVKLFCACSGKEAEELLRTNNIDCLILDLNLPDRSGFDLLSVIKEDLFLKAVPVIIYTGKELAPSERVLLKEYADSIIIKNVNSPERLLDETTLFLHRVESNLSKPKRTILKQIYEKESLFKCKKILLVDDDMRNVFAINNILEEKGLEIKVGKNGAEALGCLKEDPDIDLVLMDMIMPEMDGYQAMTAIRKQKAFEKLPVIALTAKAMKGDRAKCIEAGANDYLAKPIDREKLLSMIRVWLY